MDAIEPATTMNRRRTRRWLRRGLRALLLIALACAAICTWWASRVRCQRDAVDTILASRCEVYYQRQGAVSFHRTNIVSDQCAVVQTSYVNFDPHGCPWNLDLRGGVLSHEAQPGWLEALIERTLGSDFARRATVVEAPLSRVGDMLPHVRRLPYLRTLLIDQPKGLAEAEVNAAVERARRELPGVEIVAVVIDFDLAVGEDNHAAEQWVVEPRWPDIIGAANGLALTYALCSLACSIL